MFNICVYFQYSFTIGLVRVADIVSMFTKYEIVINCCVLYSGDLYQIWN